MTWIRVNPTTAEKVASLLLEIGSIKLNTHKPFTWSSGWKSPIYCDNRISLSYPAIRSFIKSSLTDCISMYFPHSEAIAGVATAGIPQGSLIADALQLPFVYVRPKSKDHGMENLIEGKVVEGQKVVLVEDLVSTGNSSLKAAEALKDAGFCIEGMVAIFTYGFEIAGKSFEKANVKLVCLSDFNHLLPEAIRMKYLDNNDLAHVQAWRLDPANWKPPA